MNAETIYEGNETILEDNETKFEENKTVLESNETALEDGETMLEEEISIVRGFEEKVLDSDFEPGSVILNTYRIDSDAFKGGMGSVWRVKHLGWNVDLAVKRPKPSLFVSKQQKDNFIEECKSWINLGLHPNIVSCYYVRSLGEVPTIFSEWMDNGSLESCIKDESLYDGTDEEIQERLLDIAIQFGRGLEYAHKNNLIHQDVKPDNLLLTNNWDAKVSDFGLAKARSFMNNVANYSNQSDNATQMSPSGGRTPAYCSPEQAQSLPLTIRTDIFSWAVSVLEMYMGSKPWAHGNELTGPMVSVACEDYFDMCRVTMPQDLRTLLKQCLQTNQEDRPHDFETIERQLKEIYQNVTGKEYTRAVPKTVGDNAESMNNLALSYLDLGMIEEAKKTLNKAAKGTWNGPNLAEYNSWLLNNFIGVKHNIDDNPAWLLAEAAVGNKDAVESFLLLHDEKYPEIIAPYISEIKDKVLYSEIEEQEPIRFSAKAGWLYPNGSSMLQVNIEGRLLKTNTKGEVIQEFEKSPEGEILNPLFVCASSDEQYIYVVNRCRRFEKDPVKRVSKEVDGNYNLHIWNRYGGYYKTLTGPVFKTGTSPASVGNIQKDRYLICEGDKLNWFWDLKMEKCFTFDAWGKNEKNEDVFLFTDINSDKIYLSNADNVTRNRVDSTSKNYATGVKKESRLKIHNAEYAKECGYDILEEAPSFGKIERTESPRMDGLDRIMRHHAVSYANEAWTEVVFQRDAIPKGGAWHEEKRCSQSNHGRKRSLKMRGVITESDGFVLWECEGKQISADKNIQLILVCTNNDICTHNELLLYNFIVTPKRFRAPYLISKVRSVEEYVEELDQFSVFEQEMEQKIQNRDVKGAMEVLKLARTYKDKGYVIRIAALSARIGEIGVPVKLNSCVCLTKTGEFASEMKFKNHLKGGGRLTQTFYNSSYSLNYNYTNRPVIGNVSDFPYIDYGYMVVGKDGIVNNRRAPLNLKKYRLGSKDLETEITMPENTDNIFVFKDEKTLITVSDDDLRLPINPEFTVERELVYCDLPKGIRQFMDINHRNTIDVVKRLKLYKVDLQTKEITEIGRGIAEKTDSGEKNRDFFMGSINYLNLLEIYVDPEKQQKMSRYYKINLQNRKTGEVYESFLGRNVCVSDDGMYLVIGEDLHVLDWDWESSDVKPEKQAELKYDLIAYRRKLELEYNVNFMYDEYGNKNAELPKREKSKIIVETNKQNEMQKQAELHKTKEHGKQPEPAKQPNNEKQGIFGKLFGKK